MSQAQSPSGSQMLDPRLDDIEQRIAAAEHHMSQVSAQLPLMAATVDEMRGIIRGSVAAGAVAPPAGLETLSHAMWIHGTSAHLPGLPSEDISIRRGRDGARMVYTRPMIHFVSFAIPTPTFVSNNQLRLRSVIVRFTSSKANITEVHVHDGPNDIASIVGLREGGSDVSLTVPVTGRPYVSSGIGVTVRVSADEDEDVTGISMIFHAIGAEFVLTHSLRA